MATGQGQAEKTIIIKQNRKANAPFLLNGVIEKNGREWKPYANSKLLKEGVLVIKDSDGVPVKSMSVHPTNGLVLSVARYGQGKDSLIEILRRSNMVGVKDGEAELYEVKPKAAKQNKLKTLAFENKLTNYISNVVASGDLIDDVTVLCGSRANDMDSQGADIYTFAKKPQNSENFLSWFDSSKKGGHLKLTLKKPKEIEALLLKSLSAGHGSQAVVQRKSGFIFFRDMNLGGSVAKAAAYILDPANTQLEEMIRKDLAAYHRSKLPKVVKEETVASEE